MIDNYLLEELVVFSQTGTLAETAAQLHVTQPTITRGMQRLEQLLNVDLFNRQPNRITLTKTGQMAAIEAKQLLQANRQFVETVTNFDHAQHHLSLLTTFLGPQLLFDSLHESQRSATTMVYEPLPDEAAKAALLNHEITAVISNHPFDAPQFNASLLGTETLAVCLKPTEFQANRSSLQFRDLAGMSFIVLNGIRAWRDVIQQEIPHAEFLYQDQRKALLEIIKHSSFPYFISNFSQFDPKIDHGKLSNNRIAIPISDDSAHIPMYLNSLKSSTDQLAAVTQTFQQTWPASLVPDP